MGYPTKQTLYAWITARDAVPKPKASRKKWNNTPDHPLHPSADFKMQVIRRCFELGENVQLISEGYTSTIF